MSGIPQSEIPQIPFLWTHGVAARETLHYLPDLIEPTRSAGIPWTEAHRLLDGSSCALGMPGLGIQPSEPSVGSGEIGIKRYGSLGRIDGLVEPAAIVELIAVGEKTGIHQKCSGIPRLDRQRTAHGICRSPFPFMIMIPE